MLNFIFCCIAFMSACNSNAQEPAKQAKSFTVATNPTKIGVNDNKTGQSFKGSPVYITPNGKYYILKVSAKTGNAYKKYLKAR